MQNILVELAGKRFSAGITTLCDMAEETKELYKKEDLNYISRYMGDDALLVAVKDSKLTPLEINTDFKGIAIEFARLKSHADIESFAGKYGLLGWSIGGGYEHNSLYSPYYHNSRWEMSPWLETVDWWELKIYDVDFSLKLYRSLKHGKEPLIDMVKNINGIEVPSFNGYSAGPVDSDDPRTQGMTILSRQIARMLEGVISVDFSNIVPVNDTKTGFRVIEKSTTQYLLAIIWHDLWRMIVNKEAVHTCKHCGRPFAKVGRREYCNDSCKQAKYRERLEIKEMEGNDDGR